ncbi:hypothetical protein L1987_16497 [Smallanthus sonchifolius]|uniref:Uncharacterized protein n=1 Tax=Smallanthus sonchifolius TaxID=185202 RepID=A0ACB9JC01_9ASTR|nr:hypothetical protein L1987_16497 [Smallanthus sonchifolius]
MYEFDVCVSRDESMRHYGRCHLHRRRNRSFGSKWKQDARGKSTNNSLEKGNFFKGSISSTSKNKPHHFQNPFLSLICLSISDYLLTNLFPMNEKEEIGGSC